MDVSDQLNRLIENAIDFATAAVDEFETRPKYSVQNFASAIELFIKARLMVEHWTLILSKPQGVTRPKFSAGDFQSVTLEEAAARLRDVLGLPLTTNELEAFRRLRNHRNRVVHFFHPSLDGESRSNVAREQLLSWYHMHELLTVRWSREFAPWRDRFEELDKKLRKYRDYLEAVYEALRPRLAQLAATGAEIRTCPSCEYRARVCEPLVAGLHSDHCEVCRYEDHALDWQCLECDRLVELLGEGYGRCSCGEDVRPQTLLDHFRDRSPTQKDDFTSGLPANCGRCDTEGAVVRGPERRLLCVFCLAIFENADLQSCGYCGSATAGELNDSFWSGCQSCDGAAASVDD